MSRPSNKVFQVITESVDLKAILPDHGVTLKAFFPLSQNQFASSLRVLAHSYIIEICILWPIGCRLPYRILLTPPIWITNTRGCCQKVYVKNFLVVVSGFDDMYKFCLRKVYLSYVY